MKCPITLAGLLAVFSLLPGGSAAQPLAEVARQEEARRRQINDPVKVYTNEDLGAAPDVRRPRRTEQGSAAEAPDAREPAAENAGTPPADSPSAEAAEPEAEGGSPIRDEAYWRERVALVRGTIERQQVLLDALQTRVNVLTADFVNRDDPAQRAIIAADRERALAEVERVAAEIERLQADAASVEEEARRAGVPPGWLR